MKTLSNTKINNLNYLTKAFTLGMMILLFSVNAAAQAPGKGKKGDRLPQATLKEAKVTARVITTVEEISPMRVRLNVLNPTGKTVRISIVNYVNEPIFQDAFTGKEYNKLLNFNATATGRYSLRITGAKQSEVRRFVIDSKRNRNLNQADLARASHSDIMAAIHKTEPTKIKLHLVNNTGEPVKYVFRNDAKEVIYSGVIKNAQYSKIFDMSSVTDGKYTLEVQYQTDKVASRTFDMQTVYNRSFTWTDKSGQPFKPASPSPLMLKTVN